MNSIECIHDINDINKLSKDIKYINLSIDNPNIEVIDYFLINGKDYSYTGTINDKSGYIYVDYDMFKEGEKIIDNIIDNMPSNLSNIEKVRYLYIALGRNVCFDINTLSNKNEVVSLSDITYINNIWGALSKRYVTKASLVKIFVYLCSRVCIKCEIVSNSINGNLSNKVYIDNTYIVVDLASDLANIKGGFITEHFDNLNNDKDIDKKILYIKENYADYYFDKIFKEINYTSDNLLYEILEITDKVILVDNIGSYELLNIYKKIFNKYCSDYNIMINNFYINNKEEKEHFLVFSYNKEYYSYNYSKRHFIRLEYDYLIENIKNKKIGLYLGEEFNLLKGRVTL